MGDFTAKFGSNNINYEGFIIGKHEIGQWNDNIELFIEMCYNIMSWL